ncbi:MAG: aminotransferase class IV [Methylococcales bacterium]|nr:aminotransferase class IV [Methylococcales bacterium]
MNTDIVYLNGEYVPLREAKISVLDRGFLFGDGIYEVIPCYQGQLFEFEAHIKRLDKNLADVKISLQYSVEKWQELLLPLIDSTRQQSIYLHITRGVEGKRDHLFPDNIEPTIFIMCNDIVAMPNREDGVKGLTLEDNRWKLCHVKSTALLANVLLKQQAFEKDHSEAILIRDDYVTEGAVSNLFAVINGILTTPPLSNAILPGITREVILKLANENNITTAEKMISVTALKNAEEIWLVSSTREMLAVVELDGNPVADGQVGHLWHTMNTLFQAYKCALQ